MLTACHRAASVPLPFFTWRAHTWSKGADSCQVIAMDGPVRLTAIERGSVTHSMALGNHRFTIGT